MERNVILASQSPRRQELMKLLFDKFEVCVSDVDETLPHGITPVDAVKLLAQKKARAVAAGAEESLVVGADTIVVIDGMILGKPRDQHEASAMLRQLSGRRHEVYTGVALLAGAAEVVFHCRTAVDFATLSENEIAWYVATGEPSDKAGAYGIQGYGARFIRGVDGDYYSVMGLPVHGIYTRLGEFTKEFRCKTQ